MTQTQSLRAYLYEHIPLSKAMGVEVLAAGPDGVRLSAPLEPNINHRDTVFGGSASAVAILAAWSLLSLRLHAVGVNARVVIRQNTMRYERPMTGAFTAHAAPPDGRAWDRFIKTVKRGRPARVAVSSAVHCQGVKAGQMDGEFVALPAPVSG